MEHTAKIFDCEKSNDGKPPFVAVTGAAHPCVNGWDEIGAELQRATGRGRVEKPILVVDCYPGVDELSLLTELASRLGPKLAIHAAEAYHPPEKIDQLVAPFLGSGDSMSGRFCGLSLVNFFDAEPLWRFRRTIDDLKEGLVLIVGCGASLVAWGHILVYADLARRTVQQRFARNEAGNLGADNKATAANLKYQRGYFVDWRVADRWKRPLVRRWDYVLDTNDAAEPKLADAGDVRSGMRQAVTRPFRLMAMERNRAVENASLFFDSAPEDHSLVLGFGDARFEIPAANLLSYLPRALLGEKVQSRFNGEFPAGRNLREKTGGGKGVASRVDTARGNGSEVMSGSDGWREEKMTGLHDDDLIETRRHWFTKKVRHETHGGINVLKLAEGGEIVVESPTDAFAPLVVRSAESFIVPAAVAEYTVRPHGLSIGKECATIKAFVRA